MELSQPDIGTALCHKSTSPTKNSYVFGLSVMFLPFLVSRFVDFVTMAIKKTKEMG